MPKRHRTTTERGYGAEHQRVKEQWRPIVAAGQAQCAEIRCLYRSRWIPPGTPWDLAHGNTREEYRGPAHAKCNRSEGATRNNRMRGRRRVRLRPWQSQAW